MSPITVDLARCDASPFCPVKRMCPSDAVSPTLGGYVINQDRCTSCGACIRVCPMGAVRVS